MKGGRHINLITELRISFARSQSESKIEKSAVSAQKALQRSETEKRGLLEGMKVNTLSRGPELGSLIRSLTLQASKQNKFR